MKVPIDTPQISLNVPGTPVPPSSEFGRVGSALAQTGNDVQQTQLNNFVTMKQAEAQDAANSSYYSDKIDSEKKMAELKLQSPDGYIHEDPNDQHSPIVKNDDGSPRTITSDFHDWANERFQGNQQGMPSELAAQLYRQRALGLMSEQTALLQNDVQVMKIKSYDQNQAFNVRKMGDGLASKPSVTDFYSHANDVARDFQAGVGIMHNQTDGDKKTQDAYQSLSHDLLQGAYTQILAQKKIDDPTRVQQIQSWRDILAGKDAQSMNRAKMGLPTIANMMDPVQKSVEEEKLIRLLPGATALDLSDWKSFRANVAAAAEKGRADPALVAKYQADTLKYVNSGDLGRGEGIDLYSDMVAKQQFGKLQGPSFMLASPDAREAMLNLAVQQAHSAGAQTASDLKIPFTEEEGSIAAGKIEEKLKTLATRDDDARKKDFAAYAQGTAPNGQPVLPSAQKMDKLVDWRYPSSFPKVGGIIRQGIKEMRSISPVVNRDAPTAYRPISESQSHTLAATLKDTAINEETTGKNVQSLIRGLKDEAPGVIQQMINDHALPDTWAVMKYANPNLPQATMTAMISAVRGSESVDKVFKANLAATGVKESDFDLAVGKLTQPWATAQEQANPYNTSTHDYQAASLSVVKNYAKQIYNQDISQSSSDAANKAFNQMIGQFTYLSASGAPGTFSGNTGVGITATPKQIGDHVVGDSELAVINTNLSNSLTVDSLKGFNPKIPTLPNGQPSPFADKFLPMVSRTAHPSFTVVPAPGYNIMYRSGNDAILKPLMQQDGKTPVFIPFEKATQPLPPTVPLQNKIQKFLPNLIQPGHNLPLPQGDIPAGKTP